MGSHRLPGKVLRPICGKPLLQYLVERIERCDAINTFVVATSTETADDPIVEFCVEIGVEFIRGPERDVAGRFLQCAENFGFGSFVRVSGDSPLLDVRIIQRCIDRFHAVEYDLTTNIMPRTYPRGQSVEVLRTESLMRAYRSMTNPEEFEHVTPYFYNHPSQFKIGNVTSGKEYNGLHLAVDTFEDMRVIEAIVSAMDRPHWEYGLDDVVELCNSVVAGA